MKAISILIAALALATPSYTNAETREPMKVHYQREDGSWSDWVATNVILISGSELQTKTHDFMSYNFLNSYAVIFFSQTQAAVIRLDNATFCMGSPDKNCISNYGLSNASGEDKQGQKWEFCTRSLSFECNL